MTHVTKDQAIALKEAGYDWDADAFYWNLPDSHELMQDSQFKNWNKLGGYFSAPDLDTVSRWLREVKGLHVVSVPDVGCHDKRWCYKGYVRREDGSWDYEGISKSYRTHDLALSAGIDKALNILKERNDGTNKD